MSHTNTILNVPLYCHITLSGPMSNGQSNIDSPLSSKGHYFHNDQHFMLCIVGTFTLTCHGYRVTHSIVLDIAHPCAFENTAFLLTFVLSVLSVLCDGNI